MTGHEAEASALFCQGCNCAQAVFTAFCDVTGMDRQNALRLSSSFGAGMGRLRQTCGAVSAMCMVAGMLYGFGEHCDTAEKARHYARIQALAGAFQEQFGTLSCQELLKNVATTPGVAPEARTEQYYKARPCVRFVAAAARILDDYLAENPPDRIMPSGK